MGKPVRFRRGIATVMPDCESGTASQITSLRGFSDVCDLQTLRQKPCYINQRLSEAPARVPSH